MSIELPEAEFPRLQNDAVNIYRRDYRRFRHGKSKGATGETTDVISLLDQPEDLVVLPKEDPTLALDPSDKDYLVYEAITRFRKNYIRYRSGAPKGAHGEMTDVTKNMSFEYIRKLPVVQLAELYASRKSRKDKIGPLESKFHVHIGAGKLGLGLVIPATFRSPVPCAILQRPSGTWDPILQTETPGQDTFVDIIINDEYVCSQLTLITDTDLVPITERIAKGGKSLALLKDENAIDRLVESATSFSVSLGPALVSYVGPILSKLPERPDGQRPSLYGCENDHKAVEELKKMLKNKVDVVSCMVDRICADRVIQEGKIIIGAEPFPGEIVVMARPHYTVPPAFYGKNVQLPALDAEAEYFCRRKFYLVNGTHTTLAFMTHCLYDPDSTPREYILIDWDSCSTELHNEIWAWAVARILVIFYEHDVEIIKDAHGISSDEELLDIILEYATKTLKRFSTVKDTTTRILSGGVANRWQTRLKPIDDFLSDMKLDRLRRRLLKKANIDLDFMKACVSRLCRESKRFTGLDIVQREKTKTARPVMI